MESYLLRTLGNTLTIEGQRPALTVISGMPGVGKTVLAQSAFSDLAYVDLAEVSASSLARASAADFFSVYGARLVIDSADAVEGLIEALPETPDAEIVLVGNFSGRNRELLAARGARFLTLMPLCLAESRGRNPRPFALEPVPVRISYPEAGFFESLRVGFMPRSAQSVFSGTYYEKWLSAFFAQTLSLKYRVAKLPEFLAFMRALARTNASEINHYALARQARCSYRTAIYWAEYLLAEGVLLEIPSLVVGVRRQIRRPKTVFADTGLLCYLLGIADTHALIGSPSYQGIVEGFAASEIIKSYRAWGKDAPLFYYRDTSFKNVPFVVKTPYGYVPLLFLTKRARDPAIALREAKVLSRIGLATAPAVFFTDGSVTRATTEHALFSLSEIG